MQISAWGPRHEAQGTLGAHLFKMLIKYLYTMLFNMYKEVDANSKS